MKYMAEQIQRAKKESGPTIVRVVQTDIPGNKKLLVGLTYIKGVSWTVSNAICKILKFINNANSNLYKLDHYNFL